MGKKKSKRGKYVRSPAQLEQQAERMREYWIQKKARVSVSEMTESVAALLPDLSERVGALRTLPPKPPTMDDLLDEIEATLVKSGSVSVEPITPAAGTMRRLSPVMVRRIPNAILDRGHE